MSWASSAPTSSMRWAAGTATAATSLDLVSPTPERIFFVPAVTISNFPSCSGEATGWGGDPVTPFQANVPVASTA